MTRPADLSDLVGIVTPLTPEQTASARLHVAAHATDAGDLRMLLDALGIEDA